MPAKDRLYQPDERQVDVIDPHTNTVVAVWQPAITGPGKPLVFGAKTNQFLLGTTDRRMLVLDGDTGRVPTAIAVQGPVDETAIGEGLRGSYVGDNAGVIEVIDLDANRVVETLPSEKNVHTLTVDPVSQAVYVYRNESNKVDVFGAGG